MEKYLCVPVCIFTVLQRLGIDIKFNIVEIGCELGLTIPQDVADKYPCAIVSDVPPSAGYGTQIQNSEYSLQNFFDNNNYELDVEFYYPDSFKDFQITIEENLANESSDLLVCFSVKKIFNQPHNSGHVSIIESTVDELNLMIINHGVKSGTKRMQVSIIELYNAIILHGESNMAGLWIIRYKD